MKKILFLFLVSSLFLTGCGAKKEEIDMSKKNADNKYNYQNKDLGFEVFLPGTFEYYQVQRKNEDNYVDIEFFVPTADVDYPQEIQSYAKPLVIRIFDGKSWEDLDEEARINFQEVNNKNGKIYAVKFWSNLPKDWSGKWSDVDRSDIINSMIIK